MSCFKTLDPVRSAADPFKRVKYSMGLVLGVDEFDQEQAYFTGRNRLHNQWLHGYGTICGLQVRVEGPQVKVMGGVAVAPSGKEIRICPDQCGDLARWLALEATQAELRRRLGDGTPASGHALDVHVLACYRECPTDEVPVPGGPCRTAEESVAPSRIAESFEVRFSLDPPEAREEEAILRFGRLLARIRISETAEGIGAGELKDMIRDLPVTDGHPDSDGLASPPGDSDIILNRSEADAVLREIFRYWVTEIRPGLLTEKGQCCGGPDEDCVQLARLEVRLVPLGAALALGHDPIQADETARPYLLPTRLMQEGFLRQLDSGLLVAGGDLAGDYPDPLVVGLQGRPLSPDAPLDGQVLRWQGPSGVWSPATLSLGGLDDVSLPAEPQTGQVLKFDGMSWVAGEDTAGALALAGDVQGNPTATVVTGLQTRPVSDQEPLSSDLLRWNGTQWAPATYQATALADVRPARKGVEFQYEIWFHLDFPGNRFALAEKVENVKNALQVLVETEKKPFLEKRPISKFEHLGRNRFGLDLEKPENPESDTGLLRFKFFLTEWLLEKEGDSLEKFARERGIFFQGFSHDKETVTVFVMDEPA